MAARIREALGVEVEEQSGGYGEFTVLVDGQPVQSGNPIATAFALAGNDATTTGKLHPLTKVALDRVWTIQKPDGSWKWPDCAWPAYRRTERSVAALQRGPCRFSSPVEPGILQAPAVVGAVRHLRDVLHVGMPAGR